MSRRRKLPDGYLVWQGMKTRCYNPNAIAYPLYGGRGIKVCATWRDSFKQFIHDMGPRPSKKHQLDRIDNDGDYCPENCRWATAKVNNRNRGNAVYLEFKGKRKHIRDWAKEIKINISTLEYRIVRGWTVARALTTPTRKKRK